MSSGGESDHEEPKRDIEDVRAEVLENFLKSF